MVQHTEVLQHIMQEQRIVRRITVDLRPVLREAIDLCEEDILDPENETNSVSTVAASDQGLSKEFYSQSTSQQLSKQDLQRDNCLMSTSECLEHGLKRRYEKESPIQSNSQTKGFFLPSLQNCHSCEEKLKPAQKSPQRVNMMEMNTGKLSFDKEQEFRVSPPVFFPKIILKEVPSQKICKEQRPLENENTLWLGLEKLQLPISELVKVIKVHTNSEQHTLIAKVLCTLRKKKEKDTLHQVGVLGRMFDETSQKIPQMSCGGGETRLTWIKRS
ncbi:uncharacterized protein RB166_000782 [Leptodactylus fuscus]